MSLTLSDMYNLTTEAFFREYVCEKLMFALTSPWPLEGGVVGNYSDVKERRYKATLYSEEVENSCILRMIVQPLWKTAFDDDPEFIESCDLTFEFDNRESVHDGLVTLKFSLENRYFSTCFDFRPKVEGRFKHKRKNVYFPAFVQASNLAFMIAVFVERWCYDFASVEHEQQLGFAGNMQSMIQSLITIWDHPRPPDKLVLHNDTVDSFEVHSICSELEFERNKKKQYEMLSISRLNKGKYKKVNILFKRGGGVDISFIYDPNDNNEEGIILNLLSFYYALLEIYHRARGVDTFYVIEKFRKAASVDCAAFVANSNLTSGFKCFAYVKQPKMVKLDALAEATEESMEDFIEEGLLKEGAILQSSGGEDLSLLMEASSDPFSVGGDLPPGQLHEIETEEFEAVLVRGEDEEDLVRKMEAMKTGEIQVPSTPKRKRLSMYQLYLQPRPQNAVIRTKSTFTPRKPLDTEVYDRLYAYALAIDGPRSAVTYVDNEVDILFTMAHAISSVKDDGSDASVREITRLQDEFNQAERALQEFISRKKAELAKAPETRVQSTKNSALLRGVLAGRPIMPVPEKIKAKAGALFASPGTRGDPDKEEWERSYSETMMFEDYKMLLMMRLKKEYLVRVIDRSNLSFGKPKQKPSVPGKYVKMHDMDIHECIFACTLLQYTPTYYVYAGTVYFPPQELTVFVEMIDAWVVENGVQTMRRMAEGLEDISPITDADIDQFYTYSRRMIEFKKSLETQLKAEEEPADDVQLALDDTKDPNSADYIFDRARRGLPYKIPDDLRPHDRRRIP